MRTRCSVSLSIQNRAVDSAIRRPSLSRGFVLRRGFD
jgi:hypothetical protein